MESYFDDQPDLGRNFLWSLNKSKKIKTAEVNKKKYWIYGALVKLTKKGY
jgi:hypothetical protein